MILVVLGTWRMPFTRPLLEIEALIKRGIIKDKVVVQGGNTKYESVLMEIIPFFEPQEFEKLYKDAALIICQAGIGSIMMGLKNHKIVITIAREYGYDEHIDNHQKEILELFAKQNFVLPWYGNNDLQEVLTDTVTFTPNEYPFNNEQISDAIINYINLTFGESTESSF